MKIIALDPSSTCIGFAVMQAPGGQSDLLVAGRLLPLAGDAANDRIETMLAELRDLLLEEMPEAIIIEDTSGKGGKRHGGKGAGLAVYGKAVGAVWRECVAVANWIASVAGIPAAEVVMVPENEWTDGRPKRERAAEVAALFPAAAAGAERDPGGDMADAISLGRWWLTRRATEKGDSECG